MNSRRRAAPIAIAALLIGTLLAGCSIGGPSAKRTPSRSIETVEADVARIPGVELRVGQAFNGLTPYLAVTVELAPEFTGDVTSLLDYVLAEVWSQDETAPEKSVVLGVDGSGQLGATTIEQLASLGIGAEAYAQSSVSPDVADLDKRYGAWPAAVPELPASLGATG